MKLRPPLLSGLVVLCLVAAVWLIESRRSGPGSGGGRDDRPVARVALSGADALGEFADWQDRFAAVGEGAARAAQVRRGVELARARAVVFAELMRRDPAAALESAVGFAEYAALPEEVRMHVERPFSERAELLALPVCGAGAPARLRGAAGVVHELALGGETFRAHVFGERAAIGTKEGTPLQGVVLGGEAVVREEVFQAVAAEDIAAGGFREAQASPRHCFATGRELGADAVSALAGGAVFHFAGRAVMESFDRRAARLDREPGPHTGARVVLLLADGGEAGGGGEFPWEAAEERVDAQATSWTENPKDVYFIRIDFSDVPGASISEPDLSDILSNTASSVIDAMSFGKTNLNATVSPVVVRMPSPTSAYLPNDNTGLHTDAKAAAEAQIPGLDLDGYDIVGVHFASIGIESSGGTNYAGLAGGSRQWIQGTSSSNVVIHEFGHNYGVGHASFWATTDGSVVGNGASEEYGDDFDIMGDGPNEAHFHMQAKEYLDWLEPAQWTDVSAAGSGTFRVYRFDDPATSGATRALRITKAASPSEYYWVGYRRGLPGNQWLQSGAYLLWERPGFDRAWLLDATPGSAPGRDDGMVAPGRTYSDSSAGVHITTVATGGSAPDEWVDLTVNIGTFPGNRAPAATLDGDTVADAREDVTFTASASDADGDTLAYHWDFGDGTIPSNSATQTRSWAVGGTYTVSVTVSDMKGGTVTRSLSVEVSDPLDSWTQRSSGTTADLFDIATDGSTLVAVGASNGTYRWSTDGGATWGGGDIGLNIYLRAVAWDGTQFLAAGQDYDFAEGGWRGSIYASPDGTSWSERLFTGPELRDIASSGAVHVAVGDDGTIWRSTDATSWSPIASGTARDLKGVSYGGGQWVAVGSETTGGSVVVLTSADGLSWSDASAGADLSSWQGFYDVEYCNDRFLASGWYSKIRHSTDGGATFETTRTTTEEVPAFAFGNGIYLAAGEDIGNGNAPINLISIDGATWTPLATEQAQSDRKGAVFLGDTFVTVGLGGEIWQSDTFSAPGSPPSAFATWLEGYFPGADPAVAATLDPDGDGASTLQEFATGTDPTVSSSVAHPTSSEDAGFLTLTVAKGAGAAGVAYSVERSTDMVTWDTSGTVVVTDDAASLVVRSATALDDPATLREFLRAVFTLAE